MADPLKGAAGPPVPTSLVGPLRSILVPEPLWLEDPREFVRALLARKFELTSQELEILEFVSKGLSDKEIAAQMRTLGIDRVKKIVRRVLDKLGARNRTAAAAFAARCGLAENSEPP